MDRAIRERPATPRIAATPGRSAAGAGRAASAAALAALAALAVGVPFALGQDAKPSIRATVRPRVVETGAATKITGRVRGGGRAKAVLEERRFPFTSPFGPTARQRTTRGGAFSFIAHPKRAVRYRVEVGAKASRALAVYAEPRITDRHCNLCGIPSAPRGRHVLRYRFEFDYPAAAYRQEASKRVRFYYGQRNGGASAPRRLRLVRTFPQRAAGHHATRVTIRHRVRFPRAYRFDFAACLRTSEARDGVGLPGKPGSHHCGAPSITAREARHWLG
jgi:hypothetical protein